MAVSIFLVASVRGLALSGVRYVAAWLTCVWALCARSVTYLSSGPVIFLNSSFALSMACLTRRRCPASAFRAPAASGGCPPAPRLRAAVCEPLRLCPLLLPAGGAGFGGAAAPFGAGVAFVLLAAGG